jgi:hypothetical protein
MSLMALSTTAASSARRVARTGSSSRMVCVQEPVFTTTERSANHVDFPAAPSGRPNDPFTAATLSALKTGVSLGRNFDIF